jgi:hypothetical protein
MWCKGRMGGWNLGAESARLPSYKDAEASSIVPPEIESTLVMLSQEYCSCLAPSLFLERRELTELANRRHGHAKPRAVPAV